jgi:hypothetical protein
LRASRRRALIGAAAAVPTALLAAPAAPAAAAPAATAAPPPPPTKAGEPSLYCSTLMLTPEQLEAHVLSTVQCFDTYDESLRAVGIDPASMTRATSDGATTNADQVILAQHYEDPGGQGASLAIYGYKPCNGGGVQFGTTNPWNDRIQSTAPRACSTVKHWTEPDFNGSMDTASGSGTRPLQNGLASKVSSIKYYDS